MVEKEIHPVCSGPLGRRFVPESDFPSPLKQQDPIGQKIGLLKIAFMANHVTKKKKRAITLLNRRPDNPRPQPHAKRDVIRDLLDPRTIAF